MCGIAGKAGTAPVAESDILRMCNAIAHRGPDDWGTFVEGGVGLGMRRLSIVDLAGGHQPMSNEDGSVVVVFNGEIYNFPSLHDEIVSQGHRFKTRCDTEALVHLYEEYGEGMVARLRGMFGFAIWDRTRRRLGRRAGGGPGPVSAQAIRGSAGVGGLGGRTDGFRNAPGGARLVTKGQNG